MVVNPPTRRRAQRLTNPQPDVTNALRFGIVVGLLIDIAREPIKRNRRYQQAVKTPSRLGCE
jgi:hypothetical protein